MRMQFFGKEVEIKTEHFLPMISGLVLAGVLAGCFIFRDRGDIIIEDGQAVLQQPSVDGNAGAAQQSLTLAGGISAGQGDNAGIMDVSMAGNNGSVAGMSGGPEEANGSVISGGSTADEIKVYVVGCVKNPGIVTLRKGQMICDAVREAGGLTEDADIENINMVFSLNENVMLYIKSKKEGGAVGEGAVISSDSGSAAEVIGGSDDAVDGRHSIRLVNINTAGVDELDTLPGIGEAKAKDIIAYREKYGGFSRIEDIMKVPGIKENRFESIRDYITVD